MENLLQPREVCIQAAAKIRSAYACRYACYLFTPFNRKEQEALDRYEYSCTCRRERELEGNITSDYCGLLTLVAGRLTLTERRVGVQPHPCITCTTCGMR
eukprot:4764875-Prymnesium_polylepis.2